MAIKKIAICSTKGGVGKTTVTASLTLSLNDLGYRVGALDLDSSSPTLHLAFGLTETPEWRLRTETSQIIPAELDNGIKLLTFAAHWGAQGRVMWRGKNKGQLTRQVLSDTVDWGDIDYLCIDSPPSMSEEIFILTEDKSIEGYVIVTQPQPMAIADIERLVDLCRAEKLPVFGIVSNFDGCISPSGEVFDPLLGKKVDVVDWASKNGVPFICRIPISPDAATLKPLFNRLAAYVVEMAPVVLSSGEKRKEFKREAIKIFTPEDSSDA